MQHPHRTKSTASDRCKPVDPHQRPSATLVPLIHTEEVTGSIPVSPTQARGRFRLRNRPFVILVQQSRQKSVTQPLAKLAERVAGRGRRHLGIDLHRDRNLAVPQDLHGHAGMHVQGGQQRAGDDDSTSLDNPLTIRHAFAIEISRIRYKKSSATIHTLSLR